MNAGHGSNTMIIFCLASKYDTDHFQARKFNKLFLLWNRKSSLKSTPKQRDYSMVHVPAKGGYYENISFCWA